jgi:hypothetical protein
MLGQWRQKTHKLSYSSSLQLIFVCNCRNHFWKVSSIFLFTPVTCAICICSICTVLSWMTFLETPYLNCLICENRFPVWSAWYVKTGFQFELLKSWIYQTSISLFVVNHVFSLSIFSYYSHNNDYLEICRCYKSIYEIPSIKEDTTKWIPVITYSPWYMCVLVHTQL